MAAWIAELPRAGLYGREVTGFAQDDAGVDVELADGGTLRAQYLVGCDGGRSLVRKPAGIDFPGLGGDAQQPDRRGRADRGAGARAPPRRRRHPRPSARWRRRLVRRRADRAELEREQRADAGRSAAPRSIAVYGTDFGVHSPTWISRFTDATRQAAAYRAGRVLLAGDAAHVHYPAGGQGLSLGVQDAVNLGWKLAQVVNGTSPESLLDTYHAERHPVAARALQHTMAQVALAAPRRPHAGAGRGASPTWPPWTSRAGSSPGSISGLDIHYDLGEGHPLLGRRMPDLDLDTADGPPRLRVAARRAARAAQLRRAGARRPGPIASRVDATYDGAWELPVLGVVERALRRARPPRRLRRLGRRRHRRGAGRRAGHVVRIAPTRHNAPRVSRIQGRLRSPSEAANGAAR